MKPFKPKIAKSSEAPQDDSILITDESLKDHEDIKNKANAIIQKRKSQANQRGPIDYETPSYSNEIIMRDVNVEMIDMPDEVR